mmetsp:Transcript_39146/g.83330  ORF Transcript_39146/g.83330 Transcript_39146/m.83330 type:complete len:89 (+) Transcript_39146:27-293(+)
MPSSQAEGTLIPCWIYPQKDGGQPTKEEANNVMGLMAAGEWRQQLKHAGCRGHTRSSRLGTESGHCQCLRKTIIRAWRSGRFWKKKKK